MTDINEVPWTEAETLEFADAILAGDTHRIASWLDVHITSMQREYAILGGVAMWCAELASQFMPADWDGMFALETRDASPLQQGLGQMLTAAFNRDHDALFAHVDALFGRPMEERFDVLTHLMKAFHDLGQLARAAKAAQS